MNTEYVHHVPGRLRVRMAALKRNEEKSETLKSLLGSTEGVQSVEMNLLTGSVTIYYDQQVTDDTALLSVLKDRGYFTEHRSIDKNIVSTATSTRHQPRMGTMVAAAVGTFLLKKVADHAFEALVASLL